MMGEIQLATGFYLYYEKGKGKSKGKDKEKKDNAPAADEGDMKVDPAPWSIGVQTKR